MANQGSGKSDAEIFSEHMEQLRQDARNELNSRVAARDRYSVQLILSLTAVISFSVAKEGFIKLILVAPLLSFYYVNLLMLSYKIHGHLSNYLKDIVEPSLASFHQIPKQSYWHNYFRARGVTGGTRRVFFIVFHCSITIFAMSLYFYDSFGNSFWFDIGVVVSAGYIYISYYLVVEYWTKDRLKINTSLKYMFISILLVVAIGIMLIERKIDGDKNSNNLYRYEVIAELGVNVRKSPDINAESTVKLSKGEVVIKLSSSNNWIEIDSNGDGVSDGYCLDAYLLKIE